MIYVSAEEWYSSNRKSVLIFGMSGLGKTRLSKMLRKSAHWFHYSIDYRIGTRYMGEYIADNALSEAMKQPFLRDMLLTDSISIKSNLSFDNLTPVSAYIGKPGNPILGGLKIDEYKRRQEQFKRAEIQALLDTPHFIQRAELIYGYTHFVCDTGGSICEWVDPNNPSDEILSKLSKHMLLIWLKEDPEHIAELIKRFDRKPKPMAYQPAFLERVWKEYLSEQQCKENDVNPDNFIRWTYSRALAHRQPRYEKMAKWGITINAKNIHDCEDEAKFVEIVFEAIKSKK
ncbi:MAG: ATPase [Aestuariivita sp.]|nr:ATPase [Aestuariivita sp.]